MALLLGAPVAAVADTSTAPVKDWSVETVIVTARNPGPALWHIKKDRSDIWILATVGPLPKDLKWDTGAFKRIVAHANVVLLPPRGQVGMFEGLWFLITNGDVLRLDEGKQLEAVLPPPTRARFVQARTAAQEGPDAYAKYKPSVAGFMVERDFLKAKGFSLTEPNATIEAIGANAAVPVRHVATYPALQVVKEVPSLSPAGNLKCMSDSLDDIDVMSAHARLAATAWANGDLENLKAHYSEPNALDCLGQSASFSKLWQRSVDDTVRAIDTALGRSGKTVVVINLGEFLRKNGVLERLEAQGLSVEGPGD